MHDQLADGRWFKTLSVLDEYTRECLHIQLERSIRVPQVLTALTVAMAQRGKPLARASSRPGIRGKTLSSKVSTTIFAMSA